MRNKCEFYIALVNYNSRVAKYIKQFQDFVSIYVPLQGNNKKKKRVQITVCVSPCIIFYGELVITKEIYTQSDKGDNKN